jgi:hypothetical protein
MGVVETAVAPVFAHLRCVGLLASIVLVSSRVILEVEDQGMGRPATLGAIHADNIDGLTIEILGSGGSDAPQDLPRDLVNCLRGDLPVGLDRFAAGRPGRCTRTDA